jgi:hypothetical protein
MRFYNLLSFRLFILIFCILTILGIGFSLYYLSLESEQYEEVARQCAKRTSEIVAGSTKNAMLLNQKESAYKIMHEVAAQEGIEKISSIQRLMPRSGRKWKFPARPVLPVMM